MIVRMTIVSKRVIGYDYSEERESRKGISYLSMALWDIKMEVDLNDKNIFELGSL